MKYAGIGRSELVALLERAEARVASLEKSAAELEESVAYALHSGGRAKPDGHIRDPNESSSDSVKC